MGNAVKNEYIEDVTHSLTLSILLSTHFESKWRVKPARDTTHTHTHTHTLTDRSKRMHIRACTRDSLDSGGSGGESIYTRSRAGESSLASGNYSDGAGWREAARVRVYVITPRRSNDVDLTQNRTQAAG